MEEVKKKKGRKPKQMVQIVQWVPPEESKEEKLADPPAKLEISQPQQFDPIKAIFDFVTSILNGVFKL